MDLNDFIEKVKLKKPELANNNDKPEPTIKEQISSIFGMSLPKINTFWSSIPIGVGFYYNL